MTGESSTRTRRSRVRGTLGQDLALVAGVDAHHALEHADNVADHPDLLRYYIDDYRIEQDELASEDAIWSRLEELAGIATRPGTVQHDGTPPSAEALEGAARAPDLDNPAESTSLLATGDAGSDGE